MLPTFRLLIAAMFASIVALTCGFAVFAAFRVNHEPLSRLTADTAPLQLVVDETTLGAPALPADRKLSYWPQPTRPSEAQPGGMETSAPAMTPVRLDTAEPPHPRPPVAATIEKIEKAAPASHEHRAAPVVPAVAIASPALSLPATGATSSLAPTGPQPPAPTRPVSVIGAPPSPPAQTASQAVPQPPAPTKSPAPVVVSVTAPPATKLAPAAALSPATTKPSVQLAVSVPAPPVNTPTLGVPVSVPGAARTVTGVTAGAGAKKSAVANRTANPTVAAIAPAPPAPTKSPAPVAVSVTAPPVSKPAPAAALSSVTTKPSVQLAVSVPAPPVNTPTLVVPVSVPGAARTVTGVTAGAGAKKGAVANRTANPTVAAIAPAPPAPPSATGAAIRQILPTPATSRAKLAHEPSRPAARRLAPRPVERRRIALQRRRIRRGPAYAGTRSGYDSSSRQPVFRSAPDYQQRYARQPQDSRSPEGSFSWSDGY